MAHCPNPPGLLGRIKDQEGHDRATPSNNYGPPQYHGSATNTTPPHLPHFCFIPASSAPPVALQWTAGLARHFTYTSGRFLLQGPYSFEMFLELDRIPVSPSEYRADICFPFVQRVPRFLRLQYICI